MKNLLTKFIYIATTFFIPTLIFAEDAANAASASSGKTGGKTATQLLGYFGGIINSLIPIIIGLAVLIFLWGVFKYVFASDPKNKKEAIPFITWGLIALFVMVALWGFVNLLQGAFLSDANPSSPPKEEIASLEKTPEIESSSFDESTPLLKFIAEIGKILEAAIPLIILVALVAFLFGVLKYAFSPDAKSKEDAKKFIVWGIVALTVMVFVWSLVVILQQTVFKGTDPSSIGESGEAIKELGKNPEQGSSNFTGPKNIRGGGINQVILKAMDIVDSAIPLLISFGIVLFLWGVFKYISTDSAKLKSEAMAFIVWGVVVLLVIGTVWGFVKLFADSADINIESQPSVRVNQNVSPGDLIKR